jgi:hypothetical protein
VINLIEEDRQQNNFPVQAYFFIFQKGFYDPIDLANFMLPYDAKIFHGVKSIKNVSLCQLVVLNGFVIYGLCSEATTKSD